MKDYLFTIEFNEAREIKTQTNYFNKIWKKQLKMSFIVLGCSVIGVLFNLGRSIDAFIIPMIFTFFSLIIFYSYFISKKKFKERLKVVLNYSEESSVQTVFFNEDGFGHKDGSFASFQATWNPFTTYEVWNKHLLIFHIGPGSSVIMVGENEIGEENFEEVVRAVKHKIDGVSNEVV